MSAATHDDVMPDTPSDPPQPRGLRERLAARGAKPHSRMSNLSRYLLAHHDEVAALIEADGYGWTDIAALLADEEGLTDETGKPVTAISARLAWSRLRRRRETPPPRGIPAAPAPQTPSRDHMSESDGENALPFAATERPRLEIRPARPVGAPAPVMPEPPALPVSASGDGKSGDDTAIARRLEDLARRQSARKILPPEPL